MSVGPRFTRLRRRYGASPWHLAGHLDRARRRRIRLDRIASVENLAVLIALYVGLVIGHDLILLPAYSGLDRLARAVLARRRGFATARACRRSTISARQR